MISLNGNIYYRLTFVPNKPFLIAPLWDGISYWTDNLHIASNLHITKEFSISCNADIVIIKVVCQTAMSKYFHLFSKHWSFQDRCYSHSLSRNVFLPEFTRQLCNVCSLRVVATNLNRRNCCAIVICLISSYPFLRWNWIFFFIWY